MESEVKNQLDQLQSNYPLRLLGYSKDGEEYISEEERDVNFHIIGAPKQGKSKFLIHNIIRDIELGNGLCLLDPTSNGSTAKEVLQYCASMNLEKVCVIDHTTLYQYDKIACIQPLGGREQGGVIYPDSASVDGVMEAVGILFDIKKKTETSRMTPRLEALFRTLIRQKATLNEARYFAQYNNPLRDKFLGNDEDSDTVEANFRTQNTFENYFSSSVNALRYFWKEPLSLMLSAEKGIDFKQMLRDKWVILVNLCPGGNFNQYDSQLLGVLIISQILQAADSLTRQGWKGRHYLYIDEAGRFATPQLDDILAHRRHIGISLVFAHQFYKQFENERIMDSFSQNTGVKVMFNIREPDDRLKMMKSLGYGGDISPQEASFANQDLPKQYAILRKNKDKPVRIRIPDVEIPDIDPTEYIEQLLTQPWYLSRDEINQQINVRKSRAHPQSSQFRKSPHRKTVSKAALSKRAGSQKISAGSQEPPVSPETGPIKI